MLGTGAPSEFHGKIVVGTSFAQATRLAPDAHRAVKAIEAVKAVKAVKNGVQPLFSRDWR